MNVRAWIRIIGIVSIVLASLSILTDIFSIVVQEFFVKMHEKDLQQWPWYFRWTAILGIPIHTLLLVAGISFLKRRKNGQNFLMFAIVLCIISELLPFNPFGPIYIFIALLVGLYEVKNYYDLSDDDIDKMMGGNRAELNLPDRNNKRIVLISALLLIIPIVLMVLWMYVSSLDLGYEETREAYQLFLPEILHPTGRTSMTSALLCMASLFFSIRALGAKRFKVRVLSIILMCIGVILLMMNVFSLM